MVKKAWKCAYVIYEWWSPRLLAATTLRTILGTKNLTELLSDREAISKAIVDQIDGPTDRWGIEVSNLLFNFL